MRREGYEFEVGRPQVVTSQKDGKTIEPLEELIIEVPAEHVGAVQMELGARRAMLKEQFASRSKGVTKLVYELPTRALFGPTQHAYHPNQRHSCYEQFDRWLSAAWRALQQLRNGALIAYEQGVTTPYSLEMAKLAAPFF